MVKITNLNLRFIKRLILVSIIQTPRFTTSANIFKVEMKVEK